MQAMDVLSGVRVLDATCGLPGAYATMLLADLGAEVIRLDDDQLAERRRECLPLQSLDRNKLSARVGAAGKWDHQLIRSLLQRSDALVSDFTTTDARNRGLDVDTVTTVSPHVIQCLLSDHRPDAGRGEKLDEILVQARSGLMQLTGDEASGPLPTGIPFAQVSSAVFGALAVVAYLQAPARVPTVIDVAALDSAVSMLTQSAATALNTDTDMTGFGGQGTIYPYDAFEASDGYIAVAPISNAFWRRFCAAMDLPELAADPRFTKLAGRVAHREDLAAILEPRMRRRTVADWERVLEEHDVPHGAVNDIAAAVTMPQTIHRGMVVRIDDGDRPVTVTGSPFMFHSPEKAIPEAAFRPSPVLGEHTSQVAQIVDRTPPRNVPVGGAPPAPPLRGLTIVDFSRMYAGPLCTQLLADLGADVVKVEAPGTGDPTRHNVPRVRGESVYFLAMNRGKTSRCLDLKSESGLEEVLRIVADADVVIENFRPGVMQRLGLGHGQLHAVNPDLVVCSISGFGATGPMRDKTSYDLVNQALAGFIQLTSAPNPPVRVDLPISDLAGGMYAALGVLAGLHASRRHGGGYWIDLSLHDVLVSQLACMGTLPDEGSAENGSRDISRRGGRVLPTLDGHVAVASSGRSGLLEGVAPLASWTRTTDAIALLEAEGLACTPVLSIPQALASDYVRDRALVSTLPHPQGGDDIQLASSPFVVGGRRVVTSKGPPPLCESPNS